MNIGSVAGREPYPGGAVYCASKAAVNYFSHSLRKETINSKIRVMEVDPGAVETEFSLVRFGGDARLRKRCMREPSLWAQKILRKSLCLLCR